MNNTPVHVAIAILYRENKFLMQLRDNIPGIKYPGYWGLFGGHLEAGETPAEGLKRELIEEINYIAPEVLEFDLYTDNEVVRHVFYAPLLVDINELILREGWDLGLLTPTDIQRGDCYSKNAGEVRALGDKHQQILLDFISKNPNLRSHE